MAFYDANIYKNRKAYASQEPAYGSPSKYPDPIQRPMMMIRNSESYVMAKTEQIVTFGDETYHGPRVNNFSKSKSHPTPIYYNTPDKGKYTHLSSDDNISPKNRYAPPPGYPVPYHDKGHASLKSEHRPEINTKTHDREKNKTGGNARIPYNDNNNGKVDNGGYVPPKMNTIPQIKTRIGEPEFAKSSPPKRGSQGYQEFIDSTEARRRYRGPYAGTIDCKEAAKKYNGVFVP